MGITLVQQFFYGSCIGEHTTLLAPDEMVTPEDARMLDSLHGMVGEDMSEEEHAAFEAFWERVKAAVGETDLAKITDKNPITRMCQVFYEG